MTDCVFFVGEGKCKICVNFTVCVYNILTAIGFFITIYRFVCWCVCFFFSFAFQCVCFADEMYINIYDCLLVS